MPSNKNFDKTRSLNGSFEYFQWPQMDSHRPQLPSHSILRKEP